MSPKEKLRKTVLKNIEGLPGACREDFGHLLSLLIKYNEITDERQLQYQNWVTALFQKKQALAQCTFCGTSLPRAENAGGSCFCSEPCQSEWKRQMLLVLAAYL
jgi:hypothetical protein